MREAVSVKRWICGGAIAAIALACADTAAAAAPTRGYAVFAQCPTHASHVDACFYSPIEGGYLTLGKTVMPIAKTVVLQSGLLEEEAPFVKRLAGALDGETLTKVGQTLPGGLFGSPLEAVTELAAPASSISLSSLGGQLSVTLPIRVRLVNPLLGAECSIGSDAHPIEVRLTTGTSGGLTGGTGTQRSIDEGGILVKSGVRMVNSGFAVPKAGGCGPALIDEALDAKLGLPSSANTIVFDMKLELANSELVEESEG